MPITKQEFKETLYKALEEQAKSIIEAVDFGFTKTKEDRQEIKNILARLEKRMISIVSLGKRVSQLEIATA